MRNLQIEKEMDQDQLSRALAMRSETEAADAARQAVWMRTALHDIAQPLTALECVLFLGTLEPNPSVATLRQAIDEALVQCQRMTDDVRTMQRYLHIGVPSLPSN